MHNLVSRVMDARLVALFDAWLKAIEGKDRVDSPLTSFQDFADHLLIIDPLDERHRYSHYGSAFTKAFGADLTGQIIDLVPTDILPADRRGILDFEYTFARHAKRPLWRSHTAVFEQGQAQTWQRLVLPLGEDRLAVGAYPVQAFHQDRPEEKLLRLVIDRMPVVLDDRRKIQDLALSIGDYCDSQQQVAELEVLASSDSLTGVANLRHFLHLAGLELDHAQRMERAFSLLALDIDHFKRINDTQGHAIGDSALKAFVQACRTALREYDILGRLGGEEFGVALPNTGAEGALVIAQRLRQHVQDIRLTLPNGDDLQFTVSVGVAVFLPDDEPMVGGISALMEKADQAMYRSKNEGRNRVTLAG
ncbi:Response regulator containing a CheY-like receiver domain and a GGDEF domain [Rhodospirillaceae bacterium LM-1]|nr:Response regulator containing a CheY-like receiver domain and a GGDEF domain [Rhodospirillaceae bacterium LM-1]